MGISGYEASIAITFVAPLLTALPPLKCLFIKFPCVARILTVLLGLGAYKVEDPEKRLLTITAGTGFATIGFAAECGALSNSPKKFTSLWISLLLGLLATSVFKFMCHSHNPFRPIMHKEKGGYNQYAI